LEGLIWLSNAVDREKAITSLAEELLEYAQDITITFTLFQFKYRQQHYPLHFESAIGRRSG
jgi:hypothetical protein